MKKSVILAALLAAMFAVAAVAEEETDTAEQSPEAICSQMAQEDGITPEEMPGYMEECIASMKGES